MSIRPSGLRRNEAADKVRIGPAMLKSALLTVPGPVSYYSFRTNAIADVAAIELARNLAVSSSGEAEGQPPDQPVHQ